MEAYWSPFLVLPALPLSLQTVFSEQKFYNASTKQFLKTYCKLILSTEVEHVPGDTFTTFNVIKILLLVLDPMISGSPHRNTIYVYLSFISSYSKAVPLRVARYNENLILNCLLFTTTRFRYTPANPWSVARASSPTNNYLYLEAVLVAGPNTVSPAHQISRSLLTQTCGGANHTLSPSSVYQSHQPTQAKTKVTPILVVRTTRATAILSTLRIANTNSTRGSHCPYWLSDIKLVIKYCFFSLLNTHRDGPLPGTATRVNYRPLCFSGCESFSGGRPDAGVRTLVPLSPLLLSPYVISYQLDGFANLHLLLGFPTVSSVTPDENGHTTKMSQAALHPLQTLSKQKEFRLNLTSPFFPIISALWAPLFSQLRSPRRKTIVMNSQLNLLVATTETFGTYKPRCPGAHSYFALTELSPVSLIEPQPSNQAASQNLRQEIFTNGLTSHC
jgi:hypothetical protein